MRYVRFLCIALLLCVLMLGTIPTQAAVIVVDPAQPSVVSEKTTALKIANLQNYYNYYPISQLSPDDKTLLVSVAKGFAPTRSSLYFLNVQDGTTIRVSISGHSISALTSLSWLNNQTIVFIGLEDESIPVLVKIDRATATVKTIVIELPGFPVSLSPSGTRLLFVVSNNPDQTTQSFNPLKSPFDLTVKRGFDQSTDQDQFTSKLFPAERNRLGNFADISTSMDFSNSPLTLGVLDLTSGKASSLFTSPADVSLTSIAWSQDSSKLALVRDILTQTSTNGNFLSDTATQDGLGNLAPSKNPFFQGNVVDTIDFKSGKINQKLLKAADGNGDIFGGVAWNSNDDTLMTTMYSPSKLAGRSNPIYINPERVYYRFYDSTGKLLDTLEKEELNAPGAVIGSFVSANEVMFNSVSGTNTRIYFYNHSTGEFRQLPTLEGDASPIQTTHQSRQVIFRYSSFGQAPEMFRLNFDGTALYELTFLNDSLTKAGKAQYNAVSFTLANGQKRDGYILQPQGAAFPPKNVPTIVWQEGGPTSTFMNKWGANVENPFNLLTSFGYDVLFVPLEGRIGFGTARLNALADNKNFGQIDIDEMAEIVQQSIDLGYTSKGSVGITGCSYGGYFTSQSIAKHPDLYSAANTQCTLLDLFREFQFGQTAYISYLMGRTPIDDPAEYTNDSPLLNAKQIKAATLIFDGVRDFLPYQVSVNFHDQLQANGLATNMLLFDKEPHGIYLPNDQLIAAQAQIGWFQQFLPKPQQ